MCEALHASWNACFVDRLTGQALAVQCSTVRMTHAIGWCARAASCAGIEALPEDDVFLLDDAVSPHVANPGCYRGVVVHLKLHHLAVSAVDNASQLAELAGAVTLEGLLGPASAGFKVLRELVQVRVSNRLDAR